MRKLTWFILVGLAVLGAPLPLLLPPMAQPQWYHDFADKRSLLGIPSFWNVISNLPFLVIGAWGTSYLIGGELSPRNENRAGRWMYLIFFASVALAGPASAYYHLEPDNPRLFWDRLPIATALMALLAIIITERLQRRAGEILFAPLVLLGVGSVICWHLTESRGAGDMRFYLATQIYATAAVPIILWLCPSSYPGTRTLYGAMGWYAAAKVCEFLDHFILSVGEIVSGHTLKHVGAAMSSYLILCWMRGRRTIPKEER